LRPIQHQHDTLNYCQAVAGLSLITQEQADILSALTDQKTDIGHPVDRFVAQRLIRNAIWINTLHD
jgi:hypothetical protein